jgi:hypothetical protein
MNRMRGSEVIPWYSVPMMWLVVGIPAASVLGGVAMIILAINNDDGLVDDDYYKDGMEINRILDRDRRAFELGLRAQYQLSPGSIEVRIFNAPEVEMTNMPELKLLNATRQGLDQVVQLHKDFGDNDTGPLEPLPAGRWYITLGTANWRLTGSLQIPGSNAGMLVPVGN